MFDAIPEGLTCMLLHCNAPGDIETIAPDHAALRTAEYALFRSGTPIGWIQEKGAEFLGFRTLRDAWRHRLGGMA
jgi:hypothetical protein